MNHCAIRPGLLADERAIVRLNAASETETSAMDAARFRSLFDSCSLVLVAERADLVAGFLIGFEDGATYDSVNYRWFAARLKRFFYIDRVVVAADARGAGIGRALYARAESWALAAGSHWLAAEMNLQPPNPASLRFHQRAGFVALGTQRLDGGKVVSMQARGLQVVQPGKMGTDPG